MDIEMPNSSLPASNNTRRFFVLCLALSISIHLAVLSINNTQLIGTTSSHGQSGLSLEIVRNSAPVEQSAQRPTEEMTKQSATSTAIRQRSDKPAHSAHAEISHTEEHNQPREIIEKQATATSAVTTSGSTNSQLTDVALNDYLDQKIRHALLPYFNYPLLARRHGWQGVVKVGLRVEANGHITRLRIINPSLYNALNQAAINSLSKVTDLSGVVALLAGSYFDIVLPIEYRLLDT